MRKHKYKIVARDVGRYHWCGEFLATTEKQILKELKRHLMSNDVHLIRCTIEDRPDLYQVCTGLRTVGMIEVFLNEKKI